MSEAAAEAAANKAKAQAGSSESNDCSAGNPLAAHSEAWAHQFDGQRPARSETHATSSQTHFFEPVAAKPQGKEADPKSNEASAENPFATQRHAQPSADRPIGGLRPEPPAPQGGGGAAASPLQWNPQQVAQWAMQLELPAEALRSIEQNGIDGATLGMIVDSKDQATLQEIGIASGLQRNKLMAHWQQLTASPQQPTAQPTSVAAAAAASAGPSASHSTRSTAAAAAEPAPMVKTVRQQQQQQKGGRASRAVPRASHPYEAEAAQLFLDMDRDNSGSLSPMELSCRLADMGYSDKQIMALFFQLDMNDDGVISMEEFVVGFPLLLHVAQEGMDGTVALDSRTDELMKKINDKVYQKWSSLRDAFRALDDNHNQSISAPELIEQLQRFNFNLTPEEAGHLLTYFDRNGDGVVSYLEFVNVIEGTTPPIEAASPGAVSAIELVHGKVRQMVFEDYHSMRDAFLKLDSDRSGALDTGEFMRVLLQHNIKLSPEDAQSLLQRLDRNGDGQIQYSEFVAGMQVDAYENHMEHSAH